MSIAEYLHEEGRREGREEGREEGNREGRIRMLRSLLLFKFQELDPESEARLQAASPAMLDRYARRVLTATSLAAVFED